MSFKNFFLGALVLVLASPAWAAVQVGEPAPEFLLPDTYEQEHSLSDYKGKYVVLEWLNHECPFVKKHYDSGNMQTLQKEWTDKGVVWFSVNSSAHGEQGHYHPAEANELTTTKDAKPTAVLLDFEGIVGKEYGAKVTPHMFVIAPDGTLIYQGAIDDHPTVDLADVPKSENYVEAALLAHMDGEPVDPSVTKAYGCTVKY